MDYNEQQNNKPPEGLDDFLGEQDPQGSIASAGLKQIGRALESGPAISKAPMEGVEPESDPLTDIVGGAIGAKFGKTAIETLSNTPKSLLSKDFSIMTAENPFAKTLSTEDNKALNDKLLKELKSKGISFKEVQGSYGPTQENSIIIPHSANVTPEMINELGKQYGQESVIHKVGSTNKLDFVTGANEGMHYKGQGITIDPSLNENYSTLGKHKFNLNLDFDKLHPSNLTHYSVSDKPLKLIDPNLMGTGSAGKETLRGDIIPRSYYYEGNTRPEEAVLQNAKTLHIVPRPNNILDIASDEAQSLLQKSTDINDLETQIKKAGYEGYKNSAHPNIPNAVVIFAPKKPIKSELLTPEHFQKVRKLGYAEGGEVDPADMDPQSAMAAQGLQQLGQAVSQSVPIQNVITGQGLQNYQDTINRAIAGDKDAELQVASQSLGSTMGTISPELTGGAIQRIQRQLGLSQEAPLFNNRVEAAKNLLQKTQEAFKNGNMTHTDVHFATQHLKTAERMANRVEAPATIPGPKLYAKGGEVTSLYFTPPQEPVAGLPVSAPEGLEQFTNSAQSQPGVVNSAQNQTQMPPGLDDFIAPELHAAKYGSLGQQAITGAEALGQGLVGPIAPGLEQMAGVNPEDIRARAEANPGTHLTGEAIGLIAPALATGGASSIARFTQAGALEGIGKAIGFKAGESLASKVGTTAAKAAIDNMLIAGSDETSKMILKDPDQSAQTAIASIGLAGILGAGLGAGASAGSSLWKATVGDKAGKLIEDFRGRIKEHLENPDPVSSVQEELEQYYHNVKSVSDEVYGPTGLKAQDIAKSMPEMSEKISQQAQDVYSGLDKTIKKMIGKQEEYPPRLISKLQNDLESFSNKLSDDNTSSGDVFNAIQDLKQTMQGYSKFDKFVKPVDEAYDFVKEAKGLAYDLRSKLEDPAIWGKAAERQQVINKAFKEYLPTLQDFEKKFTTEVAGDRVIDPGKINTYMNQRGKPTAEIKQTMLKNFLDASDKYKKVIDQSHINLGLESPITQSPLVATQRTLQKETAGAKLADIFIKKGLTDAGGKTLGAGLGGTLGHAVDSEGIGALIGAHTLGPFFTSILPAIAKPLIEKLGNAEGFKAAVDYSAAVAKGESLLSKASKNIFKTSALLPESLLPNFKQREKLDKLLMQLQTDATPLMKRENQINHYLPENGQALDASAMNALNYLKSLRVDLDKKAPLDSKPVASPTQKATYNRALDIAEQPLVVLNSIKDGSLTQQDMTTLSTLYPALYSRIKDKLMEQIVNVSTKGETIPYKVKTSLSMFLTEALDSSMKPENIMAVQSTFQMPSNQQEGGQQQAAPSKGTKSSPALQKMPSLFQTPSQAREQHKLKG